MSILERPGFRNPQYGRWLEDFAEGDVFVHPRGLTISPGFAQEFATVFHEANPLYLSEPCARAHGFDGIPVSPLLVLNIALSLGVQNDSEKAIAHLGYYDVKFYRPVYPGDTLRSMTRVISRRERGAEPGIVHVETAGMNQRGEPCVRYERKILIPRAPAGAPPRAKTPGPTRGAFPEPDRGAPRIPRIHGRYPTDWTGEGTYFEDFRPGDIIAHANGRTITDEHIPWTYRLGNTHPLHYDRLYSTAREGPMAGEPIVYGGLVFAWVCGLASRDTTENALWDLGYDQGFHTQPAVSGDTLCAVSRVTKVEDATPIEGLAAGIVHFELVGLKNRTAVQALEMYGEDLFARESERKKAGKEKIAEKVFEIERRVLVKKRPG